MRKIGFSAGCLYKSGCDIKDAVRAYNIFGTGINALELSFSRPKKLMDFILNKNLVNSIKKYDYVSIHASWKDIRYGKNEETKNTLVKLNEIYNNLNIDGIVIHPDSVDDFSILEKSNLPFLIENMDIRKKSGFRPEEFEKLKREYSFGFVLDTQHAYEHDSSMKLAKELMNVMDDRLKHLHVSGQDSNTKYHSLVYLADNREKIVEILKLNKNVPWILEGVLSPNFREEIKRELEFLREI